MGKAPTVAERSTDPPARATGGDGTGEGFVRVERERLGDMDWNSFRVRLRPPADPVLGPRHVTDRSP
ncbi:MAG: hypothetical protein GY906_30990 [bacterium]|nr:hypothetical protein [bacterium]